MATSRTITRTTTRRVPVRTSTGTRYVPVKLTTRVTLTRR